MDQIFLINSSLDVNLECFHILAMVSSAAVNTSRHVSLQTTFFSGHMPRSGISGSYCSYVFSFLRKLRTAVNSGCTNLHFHQPCKRVLFSPHHLQHYCLQTLTLDILIAVRCYLIVWIVLMCISPTISSVEHLFVGFLAICMSSLERCLFGLLPIFRWVDCILGRVLHELFVNFGNESLVCCIFCEYFLPSCGLCFPLVCGFLCFAKAFGFN